MMPFSTAGNANHWPGPCLAMMRDIGWTLVSEVYISEVPAPDERLALWPNPVSTILQCRTAAPPAKALLTIIDVHGRVVLVATAGQTTDVLWLAPGSYVATLACSDRSLRGYFVKRNDPLTDGSWSA